MDDSPSRYAHPWARNDQLPNLIVVAGIDHNGFIGQQSPYQDWAAVAPGWGREISTVNPPESDFEGGNSFGTLCFRFVVVSCPELQILINADNLPTLLQLPLLWLP